MSHPNHSLMMQAAKNWAIISLKTIDPSECFKIRVAAMVEKVTQGISEGLLESVKSIQFHFRL